MAEQLTIIEDFKALGAEYRLIDHPPVLTTAQAQQYVANETGVGTTKTLFLTNKKKTRFYLVTLDGNKTLSLDDFKLLVGEKKLKLASDELLKAKLGQISGAVWFYGLKANREHDIQVWLDPDLLHYQWLPFQPNIRNQTLLIQPKVMLQFIESIGFSYRYLS